ncbi:DUF6392 family protein [Pseudomonas indica]|uniref:DUF6392 family protein n=1 Tax=Pseudomonas indica TaxID=137658 RepID=UPI003FD02142
MDAATITRWIKNLGRPYDTLVTEGIIPNLPLQELYKGRDWLDIEPASGLELSFRAKTKHLETLFVILAKTVDGQSVYRGELPLPFALKMDQASVRATFGPPMESKGPIKLPLNTKTGGWDAYRLDSAMHPNAKLIFKYAENMAVNTLVFTLIDTGHD